MILQAHLKYLPLLCR